MTQTRQQATETLDSPPPSAHSPAHQLVWIDCEMTGLDVDRDGLCEIAVIITDFELTPAHPGLEIVINPGESVLAQMNDTVRQMHRVSGLLPLIPEGVSLASAEQQVLHYLRRYVPTGLPLVAGNTIGMDRRFIAKYLPRLDQALHYRSIDVSTIKELVRRWHPTAFSCSPKKQGGHRALNDIAESIRELAYLRETVLVPSPGPSESVSTQLAAEIVHSYASLMR